MFWYRLVFQSLLHRSQGVPEFAHHFDCTKQGHLQLGTCTLWCPNRPTDPGVEMNQETKFVYPWLESVNRYHFSHLSMKPYSTPALIINCDWAISGTQEHELAVRHGRFFRDNVDQEGSFCATQNWGIILLARVQKSQDWLSSRSCRTVHVTCT